MKKVLIFFLLSNFLYSFFFLVFLDDNDKPVYIITTLDNVEDDLLTLEYTKVRKE